MMEEMVTWVRWFNFICYFLSLMILLYKFVLTNTLCKKHPFDWVRFVLALHLILGIFSLGEIILTDAGWGWRTYATVLVATATLWATIFRVRVEHDCE